MKQFNLSEYLENPSRKIVTRSGHNVRILCTDQRGNMPIVALVEFETLDGVQLFYHDGKNESHREYDLFFADEGEELTEFEKELINAFDDVQHHTASKSIVFVKKYKRKLLDLARKELLKDLLKWKKATEHKDVIDVKKPVVVIVDDKVLLSSYIEKDDYYIELDNLKTLPKEE